MAEKKSDSKIIGMVREAHRVANVALNAVHSSRLVEHHEVAGLANSLIAGRHISTGSSDAREVDHAGGSATNDDMLSEAYGEGSQRSSGSY
jgi:hypothetical protein